MRDHWVSLRVRERTVNLLDKEVRKVFMQHHKTALNPSRDTILMFALSYYVHNKHTLLEYMFGEVGK